MADLVKRLGRGEYHIPGITGNPVLGFSSDKHPCEDWPIQFPVTSVDVRLKTARWEIDTVISNGRMTRSLCFVGGNPQEFLCDTETQLK